MKNLLIGLLMLVTTNVMAVVSPNVYMNLERVHNTTNTIHVTSTVKCVEGYQYLYTLVGTNIAVTQMFENPTYDGSVVPTRPIKCKVK